MPTEIFILHIPCGSLICHPPPVLIKPVHQIRQRRSACFHQQPVHFRDRAVSSASFATVTFRFCIRATVISLKVGSRPAICASVFLTEDQAPLFHMLPGIAAQMRPAELIEKQILPVVQAVAAWRVPSRFSPGSADSAGMYLPGSPFVPSATGGPDPSAHKSACTYTSSTRDRASSASEKRSFRDNCAFPHAQRWTFVSRRN